MANANAIARTLGKQVGWVYIEGGWYYYLGGEKATGWVYIDGIYYFMNNDGILCLERSFLSAPVLLGF